MMIMVIKMKKKMTVTIIKMTTKVDSALPATPSSLEQLANWQSLLHTQVIAKNFPGIRLVLFRYLPSTFQVFTKYLRGVFPIVCHVCVFLKTFVWQRRKIKKSLQSSRKVQEYLNTNLDQISKVTIMK